MRLNFDKYSDQTLLVDHWIAVELILFSVSQKDNLLFLPHIVSLEETIKRSKAIDYEFEGIVGLQKIKSLSGITWAIALQTIFQLFAFGEIAGH